MVLVSETNHYNQLLLTDESGNLVAKCLPFGTYQVQVKFPQAKCQPDSFSTSTLYMSAIQKKILRAS